MRDDGSARDLPLPRRPRLAGAADIDPEHVRHRDVLTVLLRARNFVAEGWAPPERSGSAFPQPDSQGAHPWTIREAIEASGLTQHLSFACQAAFYSLTAVAGRPGGYLPAFERQLSTQAEALHWLDLAIRETSSRPNDLWDDGWQEWGEAREIALNAIGCRTQVREALGEALTRVRRRWLPGGGEGYQALAAAGAAANSSAPRASGWTLTGALTAAFSQVASGDALNAFRLHMAFTTEMSEPLHEYGGDSPEPRSGAEAEAWLLRELDAVAERWALPDSVRLDAVRLALAFVCEQCAAGVTLIEALESLGGQAGEDARYALAIAIGSSHEALRCGGSLLYTLDGEPLTDIINHSELADLPSHAHLWSWLGRASGLTFVAWPMGEPDFPPFGRVGAE